MNFEEFRERLMEDLKDSLQDRTGKEYTADANHVKKLQNPLSGMMECLRDWMKQLILKR